MKLWFEGSPAQAVRNLRKHRATFETAARAFANPLALTAQDRAEAIRVVSARRADPKERRRHERETR